MTRSLAALLPATSGGRALLGACAVLAVAERVGEAAHKAPPWATSYADDLLCLPLVLALVLAVHRAAGRPASWRLPAWHGLTITVVYALVFEVLLPRWQGSATPDRLDVAAYFAGFLVFQLLANRPTGTGSAGPRARGSGLRPVARSL